MFINIYINIMYLKCTASLYGTNYCRRTHITKNYKYYEYSDRILFLFDVLQKF